MNTNLSDPVRILEGDTTKAACRHKLLITGVKMVLLKVVDPLEYLKLT